MAPVEPSAPTPPDGERPRSSFEDYEIPEPEAVVRRGRPAIVSTAALILFVAALLNALYAFAFKPSGIAVVFALSLGAAQLVGAVLVFSLRPIGKTAGLVLGTITIGLGVVRATADPTSGLMTMALGGFVVWAVIAAGPSYRRR